MKHIISLFLATCAVSVQAQNFTIELAQPRQTIQHFGASDAWSMQFIGLWDNEAEQQKVADWLFSTENDAQGKPLGIGLSVWRFNLGAGSAEQGEPLFVWLGIQMNHPLGHLRVAIDSFVVLEALLLNLPGFDNSFTYNSRRLSRRHA